MKPCFLLLVWSVTAAGQYIEGDLVNRANGEPVPGAYISADTSTPITERISVRSNARGHFRIPDEGVYGLQIIKPGFLRKNRSVRAWSGKLISNLRIELTPAAVISGRIEDEDGFPVNEAQIQAACYRQVNGERRLVSAGEAKSDDLGRYRILNLPAGRYWVHAVPPVHLIGWDARYVREFFPGGFTPDEDSPIEVKTGQELSGVDLRLTKFEGVTVSGSIELPAAMEGYRRIGSVYLESTLYSRYRLQGSIRQDGSFVIPHVPPGDYTLGAGDVQPMAGGLFGEQKLRIADANRDDIVLQLREIKPQELAGSVVMEGGGAPPSLFIRVRGARAPAVSARANQDGSFVLKDLLADHYDLEVYPAVAVKKGSVAAYPVSARLGNKEVLKTGFEVDGTITDLLQITLSSHIIQVTGRLLGRFRATRVRRDAGRDLQ